MIDLLKAVSDLTYQNVVFRTCLTIWFENYINRLIYTMLLNRAKKLHEQNNVSCCIKYNNNLIAYMLFTQTLVFNLLKINWELRNIEKSSDRHNNKIWFCSPLCLVCPIMYFQSLFRSNICAWILACLILKLYNLVNTRTKGCNSIYEIRYMT